MDFCKRKLKEYIDYCDPKNLSTGFDLLRGFVKNTLNES